MIKPFKLKLGDTVGIISPSAFLSEKGKQQLLKGVRFIENLGFKVKIGKNALKRYFYSAGTVEERVSDFHDMFLDKEVKAIFQSQGGETTGEILKHIDWGVVKSNPKLFGGMSDGTTLLLAIYAKTGLVTLHGPDVIWGYGRGVSEYERNGLIKTLLSGEIGIIEPDSNHKVSEDSKNSSPQWRCWRKGTAEGKLIGGNLSVIERLHGTEYEPDYSGSILFLEDIGYSPEKLANKFTHLKLVGILDKISGVVLGYFSQNAAKDAGGNRPVGEIFLEVTKNYTFPILEIGEIGHNTPNINLPIGVSARVNSTGLKFSILEPVLN